MIKKLFAVLLSLLAAAAFAAVDVNKATQADLESIKGIGPVISTRILDERKKAPFKDWQDMVTRVNGVGERNAAKFSSEGMTVNGAAFAGAPAAQNETKATQKAGAKPTASADAGSSKAMKATAQPASSVSSSMDPGDRKTTATATGASRQTRSEERAAKAATKAEAKAAKAAAVASAGASAPAKK